MSVHVCFDHWLLLTSSEECRATEGSISPETIDKFRKSLQDHGIRLDPTRPKNVQSCRPFPLFNSRIQLASLCMTNVRVCGTSSFFVLTRLYQIIFERWLILFSPLPKIFSRKTLLLILARRISRALPVSVSSVIFSRSITSILCR